MVKKHPLVLLLVMSLLLTHCNVEKEIEVSLPGYPNTPYLECYLEPGKPYRLLAYKSIGYFDELVPDPIRNAVIAVTHRGNTVTLPYDTIPREGDLRFYNYRSADSLVVPSHFNEQFQLSVTWNGTTYYAVTTLPAAVAIDTVITNCNEDTRCQVSIRFRDNTATRDFYRFLTFADSLGGDVKQNFVFNDELISGENGGIGGGYNFNEGQQTVVRLFHLTKEHYDFLVSVEAAQNANGNPFAQPARIKSNIPGWLGIFTGLAYDSKQATVQ